jgi:hypothetical protein
MTPQLPTTNHYSFSVHLIMEVTLIGVFQIFLGSMFLTLKFLPSVSAYFKGWSWTPLSIGRHALTLYTLQAATHYRGGRPKGRRPVAVFLPLWIPYAVWGVLIGDCIFLTSRRTLEMSEEQA